MLPVIFFHAGFQYFSGGFVGVDVFFVISGYLITNIILSELSQDRFSVLNFYERRARRILPALFFVMLTCIPFAWFLLTPNDLKDFGESLIAVSTFSSNFLFWFESGYFETTAELKPLLHTWSLAVEEQYYIIFPIFLLAFWRFGIKSILLILGLAFFASLLIAEWGAYNKPSATFYLLPTRGWELLIGVFIAFYLKYRGHFKSSALNQILSISGLGMIVYSIIFFDESTPFPSFFTLIPTVGTGLLILSAVNKTIVYKILSLSPIVSIGLISYSAYLWHQPLLAFAKHRFLEEVSDLMLIILCLSSLVLAYISWKWVEKPFRDKARTSRKFILNFSVLGILFFSAIGMSMLLSKGFEGRVNFSEELKDSFSKPQVGVCFDRPYNHSSDEWGCLLGTKKEKVDFILFGDSHALSLKSIVDKIAIERGLSVFFTGSSGCPPFIGAFPNRPDQVTNNCKALNDRVLNYARKQQVNGIIFSARWSYYIDGSYDGTGAQLIARSKDGPFTKENSIKAFNNSFLETVKEYKENNIPIYLISQPPQQTSSPETFYFRTTRGIGSIYDFSVTRDKFESLERIPVTTFKSFEDEINFFHIIDEFCDEDKCLVGEVNKSFYYDDDHLSTYGSMKLKGIIEEILK